MLAYFSPNLLCIQRSTALLCSNWIPEVVCRSNLGMTFPEESICPNESLAWGLFFANNKNV